MSKWGESRPHPTHRQTNRLFSACAGLPFRTPLRAPWRSPRALRGLGLRVAGLRPGPKKPCNPATMCDTMLFCLPGIPRYVRWFLLVLAFIWTVDQSSLKAGKTFSNWQLQWHYHCFRHFLACRLCLIYIFYASDPIGHGARTSSRRCACSPATKAPAWRARSGACRSSGPWRPCAARSGLQSAPAVAATVRHGERSRLHLLFKFADTVTAALAVWLCSFGCIHKSVLGTL